LGKIWERNQFFLPNFRPSSSEKFTKLRINEEDAAWDSLGMRLSDVFKVRSEKVAFLQGEDIVMFSDVARAIDIMHSSGVEKVGLMTAN
jgi:biopolymer transport protein ExbD